MFKLLLLFRVHYLLIVTLLLNPFPAVAGLDLASWSNLLGAAVNDGQVDYSQWDENPRFDELVTQIAVTDTTAMNTQQKLVFTINAYNILAARGILDGSSPTSLFGRYVYFKRDKYFVAGEKISLYQLEQEWIRPLKEPRIHFAIVCASKSCPILRNEAYTLKGMDRQLNSAAHDFINDSERNGFDSVAGQAKLSRIFKWYEEDFVVAAGSLQAYLAPFLVDKEAADILVKDAFNINYQKYDWHLNGTR